MNRIFRIVWNRALGQMVVASELCRSRSKGGRSAGGQAAKVSTSTGLGRLSAGILLSLVGLSAAHAHTSSIGYSNPNPYELTFWYGTYHQDSDISGFEGSFHLVSSNGMDETVPFTERTIGDPSDPVIAAAMDWLLDQPSCQAG